MMTQAIPETLLICTLIRHPHATSWKLSCPIAELNKMDSHLMYEGDQTKEALRRHAPELS